jgi:hypothetical protein
MTDYEIARLMCEHPTLTLAEIMTMISAHVHEYPVGVVYYRAHHNCVNLNVCRRRGW